jgi:hypothetical protein
MKTAPTMLGGRMRKSAKSSGGRRTVSSMRPTEAAIADAGRQAHDHEPRAGGLI